MLSRPSDDGHTPFGDIYLSQSPDMCHWGMHRLVMRRGGGEVGQWWQRTKIGAGPIPIETDDGWLMIYHGVMDTCNGFVYSMGAALLDLDEPWRVLYRTNQHILTPEQDYEVIGPRAECRVSRAPRCIDAATRSAGHLLRCGRHVVLRRLRSSGRADRVRQRELASVLEQAQAAATGRKHAIGTSTVSLCDEIRLAAVLAFVVWRRSPRLRSARSRMALHHAPRRSALWTATGRFASSRSTFRICWSSRTPTSSREPNPWRWPDEFEIEDALESVRQMGGQVVRTYVVSVHREGSDMGDVVHVRGPGEFNEEGFRALDKVIEVARRKGIRVIIPLVDQHKWWGGIGEYAAFRGKPADAFWTDRADHRRFQGDGPLCASRARTFTRASPIATSRRSLAGRRATKSIRTPEWTREIAAYIKELDPNHLVIDGKSLHGVPRHVARRSEHRRDHDAPLSVGRRSRLSRSRFARRTRSRRARSRTSSASSALSKRRTSPRRFKP